MIRKDDELNQQALTKKSWVSPALVSLETLETASKTQGGSESYSGLPVGPS